MILVRASKLAEEMKEILAPHCEQIEIAGSIRREKPEVGDIEIVCIPREEMGGLFCDEPERSAGFVKAVNELEAVKGKAEGKYTQRIYKGMKVDIFIASRENWGVILAIRTGSADFSHHRLAARWVKLGYVSRGGILYDKEDEPQTIGSERELFALLGMKWIEPQDREYLYEHQKH